MTNYLTPEERDELASAYLDGEASPDQVAQIEADTELRRVVSELGRIQNAVSTPTPPPEEELQATQIEAALSAFDQIHHQVQPSIAEVGAPPAVSRAEHRARPRPHRTAPTNRAAANQERLRHSKRRSGLPTWLSVAAVSLALLGGIAVATTQFRSTNESDVASDRAPAEGATPTSEETLSDAVAEATDEAMSDEAMSDEAEVFESSAEDAMADSVDEEAELATESSIIDPAALDTANATTTTIQASSGEPAEIQKVASFPAGTPAFEIHDALGADGFPVGESLCGFAVVPPRDQSGAETYPSGYFPVLVGTQPAELLIYGQDIALLVATDTCDVLDS